MKRKMPSPHALRQVLIFGTVPPLFLWGWFWRCRFSSWTRRGRLISSGNEKIRILLSALLFFLYSFQPVGCIPDAVLQLETAPTLFHLLDTLRSTLLKRGSGGKRLRGILSPFSFVTHRTKADRVDKVRGGGTRGGLFGTLVDDDSNCLRLDDGVLWGGWIVLSLLRSLRKASSSSASVNSMVLLLFLAWAPAPLVAC